MDLPPPTIQSPIPEIPTVPAPPSKKQNNLVVGILLLLLLISLPVAYYVAQQPQEIRQRAQQLYPSPSNTNSCPAPGPNNCAVYECPNGCTDYGRGMPECLTFSHFADCATATVSNCGQIDYLNSAGNQGAYCGVVPGTQCRNGTASCSGGGGGGSSPRPSPSTTTNAPTLSLIQECTAPEDIKLTWTTVTNTTNYRVERCTNSNCTNFSSITTESTNTYTDTSVTNGSTYRYRVRAFFQSSNTFSPYSNVVSITLRCTVAQCGASCTTDSNCPSGLTCSSGACRNPSCTSNSDCICIQPSPTPSPTPPADCGKNCTTGNDCMSGMTCYIQSGQSTGVCRVPACLTDSDCICNSIPGSPGPTPSVTPTVPRAGTAWPTVFIIGAGILLLTFGLAF